MTASVHAWHGHLGGTSMEGIEEGLLDETDNLTLKLDEKSTAFPGTAEHGWKELVSDPSLSEVEISENSKIQENYVKGGFGHKDWDHYLSAFSLNDEDTTNFMALEAHTDHGQENLGISGRADGEEREKEHFVVGNKSATDVMEGVENVTLPVVSKFARKKNIVESQGGQNQGMLEQESSSKNSSRVLEDDSFPTTSKQNLAPPKFAWSTKEYSPDGGNLYGRAKTVVRPGSAPTITDNELISQPGLMPDTSDIVYGLEKSSKSIRRPGSVPLQTSVGVDWQPLIQMDKNSLPISNVNAYWQTEPIMRARSAPAREATEMQTTVEERNILPADAKNVSNVMFNSSRNLSLTNSGVLSNINGRSGEKKTLQTRSKSALNIHGNSYFLKQSSSVPRANSAPLWQDKDTSEQSPSLGAVTISPADFQTEKAPSDFDHVGHVHSKKTTRMDDWERPLEQRKISGADEDILQKTRSISRTNSAVMKNTPDRKTLDRKTSHFARQSTGMNTKEEKRIPFEDFPHLSGDGKDEKKSEDDMKGNFENIGNVSDVSDTKEERYSADLRFNTNPTSSDTQNTLTTSRPGHTESTTETSNVATSREAAENLPVRPLTIGDSLTIASTLAYRPISPFEPDLYPTGTATSVPIVPSTTSVATTYLSPSQYSEGTLDGDEEREGDMSARERLQPLGRDGLEVKQGPPWGIMMPLFQPHSRDSSLSSNDSSTSHTQFLQLQTTSNQQFKLETEPLQSMSSTPSETDLSRKASIKSLEPKEPMGVKVLSGAGNLKTPIGKFRQQNPVDGDSPVSKILGPTFKATQKMLEELQRRLLGAYDEDLEQLPMDTENTRNTFERETAIDREMIVTDKRPNSRSYGGLESDAHEEINCVEEGRYGQDSRRSQSYDSTASREKIDKTTPDSRQGTPDLTSITNANLGGVNSTHSSMVDDLQKIGDSRPSGDTVQEFSTNQRTPNLTPITTAHLGVVDNNRSSGVVGRQGVPVSRTFSKGKEIKTPTRSSFNEGSINRSTYYDLTPVTTANVLASTTRSPVIPMKDGIPQRVVVNLVGSHSWRNESRKIQQTSGMTDSTLGNSVGLSGHLVPTEVDTENEGGGIRKPENLKSENRNGASDLSEFDRVASESISWSNAVASQFREEMKSVDLEVQQRFVDPQHGETLVNEPGATTPILDSGLSESSTNDEIYRPKRLTRLSTGNGPVGIYDVRQSSGPGSTNRKRLALGKKPRESSKSLQMRNIYVSDGATGTSGTDRDSRQSRRRVHGGVYVSEGTTSGTEPVDNGIDSGPEGQSTPKSEDISARQSNAPTTSDFSPRESSKPVTDMYVGLTNSEFEKPTKDSHSSFTTYGIEKPTRLSPSVFLNYKPSRQDPPPFSTFEIDKLMRANPPGTSSNGTLTRVSVNLETKVLAGPQKGGNFTRLQPAAKVEHTWSISRPVMSQLSTGAAPLVIHDAYQQPRRTTQQHALKQPTSHRPEHRRKRAPRHKQILPKTIQQHAKNQAADSMESEKSLDKNEKKKSVADIILENMIQDEQEQKKRHKRLEVKQEQTTQDLNHLWERFQDVFGKKSRSSRKTGRIVRSRPSRETTPTDISPASSSDTLSSENRNISRQSVDTDSDEEFERFLRRIREIQSSESSYQEDNGSTSSRLSSGHQRVIHNQSETTPVERLHHKPRHETVDSSTSMTSIASSDDRRVRRNVSQVPSHELLPRKATRQNLDDPVVVSSSVTERKSESPVSLPMWLSVKNKEMMKQGKTSSSCTCGAKSRKEKQKTSSVRDIGVNCPTPPIQEFLPVATDIAVLKAGPLEENISNPASLIKLSLQDAFMYSKQDFVDRSRERVKKLKEKREEREKTSAQVVVVVPSEKTKPKKENKRPGEDRMFDTKPNKQFEQLQRKKPRPMTNKEIRNVNKRMYKSLPEVRKRKDEERRAEFYKTNRLRAQLYGKHVRNTNRIFTAA